jgi:signal transduction histidine kinase
MTTTARVWILRTFVVIGMGLGLTGMTLALVDGTTSSGTLVPIALAPFAFSVWILARRESRNRLVWVLAWAVLLVSAFPLGEAVSSLLWPGAELPDPGEPMRPGTPEAFTSFTQFYYALGSTGGTLLLTFGLLLFPDGALPSRKWRWIGWIVAAAVVFWSLASFSVAVVNEESFTNGEVVGLAYMFGILSVIPAFVSLVIRYRQSVPTVRAQIKWIVWGAFFFVPSFVVSNLGGPDFLGIVGIGVFGTAYGVAISNYRLYDIDVVISRTLVYGALAIFIGAVYVGIVVGLSTLLDTGDDADVWLGIAATVVVAIAFQPLRRSLEKAANRLVFGRRATPYEVLSTLAQRVAGVDPGVLTQIAGALVEGTTADVAAVWIKRGDELQLIAHWPSDEDLPLHVSAEAVSMFSRVAEVVHDGEELGALTVSLGSGQSFSPVDSELLDRVAAGLGLALRNLMLTEDLRFHLQELRDSRRRIVAVQDRTRRQLERDLHDGAQQRLVSLKIKLGIAEAMASKEGLDETRERLDALIEQTDESIGAVRDFARGIYPPLLEAEGLEPALLARTRGLPIPVTVQTAGISRYPREVEATVYFCVLEAVQNAIRHSGAGSIWVSVTEGSGAVSFDVGDDGSGFDADAPMDRHGLQHMEDRLDAIGGTMRVESSSQGTSVVGQIPVEVGVTV